MKDFDGLNNAFGSEPSELQKHVESVKPTLKKSEEGDVKQDYEMSRANLHNLVMKGQEALDGIMDVAQSSDHPRAYEVAALMIKNVADTTDKLMKLQKETKEVKEEGPSKGPSTVNNTMFVGSTAELAKMLKKAEESTDV